MIGGLEPWENLGIRKDFWYLRQRRTSIKRYLSISGGIFHGKYTQQWCGAVSGNFHGDFVDNALGFATATTASADSVAGPRCHYARSHCPRILAIWKPSACCYLCLMDCLLFPFLTLRREDSIVRSISFFPSHTTAVRFDPAIDCIFSFSHYSSKIRSCDRFIYSGRIRLRKGMDLHFMFDFPTLGTPIFSKISPICLDLWAH